MEENNVVKTQDPLVVTHIFWGLSCGGIETMLVNIANNQALLGCRVHIIIINDRIDTHISSAINQNVTFHCLSRKVGSKSPLYILRLDGVLKKISPDIIHLHRSEIYSLLFNKWRSKVCCTVHDSPGGKVNSGFGFLPQSIQRILPRPTGNVYLIHKISKLFAISNEVKFNLIMKYGVESQCIYNGIDTSKFKVKRPISIKDRKFNIVQVSRLQHKKKGQDLLVEAMSKLHSLGYNDISLTFIGEGESKSFLDKMIKDRNLESKISFKGLLPQECIQDDLCSYDLFVQPSRFEGFGLTVAEAMASGIPVLVSSGTGAEEVIGEGAYGTRFNNGQVEDLVAKIIYLYENYDEAITKAEKALSYVRDNFDVMLTTEKYLQAYRQIIDHN